MNKIESIKKSIRDSFSKEDIDKRVIEDRFHETKQ
jgi:hypothetical protein